MYVEIGSVFKCRKSLLPSGSGVQCGRDHQPLRANEPVGLRGSFEGRLNGAIVFHVRVVQDELRMLHKRLLHSVGCSAMLFSWPVPWKWGHWCSIPSSPEVPPHPRGNGRSQGKAAATWQWVKAGLWKASRWMEAQRLSMGSSVLLRMDLVCL